MTTGEATSPALRLLAANPRVVRSRVGAVAAGVLARARLVRGWAVWPSAERPAVAVEPRGGAEAGWVEATFTARRAARRGGGRSGLSTVVGEATWSALRARAFVTGRPNPTTVQVAERGLGRRLTDPRLALYSGTGAPEAKASCFVFDGPQAPAPVALVRAMSDPSQASRLRHEIEAVETLRDPLTAHAAELAAGLPMPPLHVDERDDDYLVVLPIDPLAAHTGQTRRDLDARWLRGLHAATATQVGAWTAEDSGRALELVGGAFARVDRTEASTLTETLAPMLGEVEGAKVERCASHGDFWRGNIARKGDEVRVFDWEWSRLEGLPFLDLWCYELGEVRTAARRGDRDPDGELRAALDRVRGELEARGLDSRFALETLAPAVAELAMRHPRVIPAPLVSVMGAVRRLLVGRPAIDG